MNTLKNKVYATILMAAGLVPVFLMKDLTVLVFLGCFAVPMFFAKENWIY